jgi:site-specific DNA-methyltransferase (adenine-specific)
MNIEISKISVPEGRQRQQFDQEKIAALAKSIEENGLIHAIVIDDSYQLIVGERRLRAVQLLKNPFSYGNETVPLGSIPAVFNSQLTEEQRFAVELEENVNRENLTWQEKAAAIVKLHSFRKQQEGQTIEETAGEAKVSNSTVIDAILVEKHLSNPVVAKAKDLKSAVKEIKRLEEAKHRAVLAKTFDLSKTPHRLVKGNSYEILHTLEPESFSCILTDPPYGIGADSFGDQAGVTHDYGDDRKVFETFRDRFPEQSYRLARENAFLYIFCDYRYFSDLDIAFTLAGWRVWPRPLIWNKTPGGMLPQPDRGPRYSYECILYATKGEAKVVKQGASDVLSYTGIKKLLHAAQKPAALYCDLLSRVCKPGDTVLDPFAGSGTIFVAGNTLSLSVCGIEQEEDAFNLALSRISSRELYEEEFEL